MGITIFTPTYNRAYVLKKLYISLCAQTNHEFEWLIVDDGSTDSTMELVKEFIDEGKVAIRYFFQKNAGKSMAHNKAVALAKHELFTCVDSDDYLTRDAVETVLNRWKKIRGAYVGIVAKRMTNQGNNITKTSLSDGAPVVLREAYQNKKLFGDTFLIFDTNVVKRFAFPQFKDEKFVPEAYLYDQIEKAGNLCLLDQALYICEYLEDGYTRNMNRLIANNPLGYRAFVEQRIELNTSFASIMSYLIRYEGICFVVGNGYICKKYPIASLLMFFPGWLMYMNRFRKFK